jgi:adenylate cyclase
MTKGPVIRFSDCELYLDTLELRRNKMLVAVEPQVFDLIRFFAENSDRLVTRDDILEGVWGGRIVSDAAISTRINLARKALGDDGKSQQVIKTIPRRGFRFLPRVIKTVSSTTPVATSTTTHVPLRLPQKPSIALMPLECLSDDVETQNLAQGLRIDVQNALIRVSSLFITAIGSANAVASHTQNDAAEVLGVQYFLQGQVRRDGKLVRLSVQLIDVVDNRIVWSDQYDRKFEDTFRFLDELTSEILTAMNVHLVAGEAARVWHKTLSDLKSLEVFYRGIANFFKMTSDSMNVARRNFENIAHHHPNLSVGPTWVSLTHWYELQRGWATSPGNSHMLARQWAQKAAGFKESDGQAYTVLSHVCLLERDFDAALEAGAAAVQNRPSCAHANGFYANVLHYCGKQDLALKHIRLAIRHSPIHPPLFKLILAAVLRAKGALGEATAIAGDVLITNPEEITALVLLAALSAEQEDLEAATEYVGKIMNNEPEFSVKAYLQRHPYRDEKIPGRLDHFLLKAGLSP